MDNSASGQAAVLWKIGPDVAFHSMDSMEDNKKYLRPEGKRAALTLKSPGANPSCPLAEFPGNARNRILDATGIKRQDSRERTCNKRTPPV